MSYEIPKFLIQDAHRVVYACRVWAPEYANTRTIQMVCADCGTKIAVTPSVLANRRKQVHALGRSLAVVCDDCAIAEGERQEMLIAAMPSDDEIKNARSDPST